MSLRMSYEAFDVTALIQGAAGAVQYIRTVSGDFGNYFKEFADDRWRPDPSDPTGMRPDPNADTSGPRAFQREEEYWIANANTFFLRNTEYISLEQLKVCYKLTTGLPTRLAI